MQRISFWLATTALATSLTLGGTVAARHAYETLSEPEEAALVVTPSFKKTKVVKPIAPKRKVPTAKPPAPPVIPAPPPLPNPAAMSPNEAGKFAQKLANQARLPESLPFYTRALVNSPTPYKIYRDRGNVYDRLGKYDEAIADLNHSLQMHYDALTLQNKAEAFADSGNFKGALAICDDIIATNANNLDIVKAKATILNQAQDFNGAISVLTAAINKNPSNMSLVSARAQIYMENSHYEEALKDWTQVAQTGPGTSQKFSDKARCELHMRNTGAALADVDAALKIDPNNIEALLVRSEIYRIQQRFDLATQGLDQVLRINPFNTDALKQKGSIYEQTKKYELALPYLQKVLDLAPLSKASLMLALTYHDLGNKTKCYDVINESIRLSPREGSFYYARAVFENLDASFEKALADDNMAVKLCPYKSDYYLERVNTFSGLHRPEDALADLKHIETLQHNREEEITRLIAVSKCLVSLKQDDKAIASLSQALKTYPNESQLYSARGDLYDDAKKNALALSDFQKAASLSPKHNFYQCQIAYSYAHAKQYDKAIAEYKLVSTAEPKSAEYPTRIAYIFQTLKNYSEALKWCLKAQALDSKDPYIYRLRATIVSNIGGHAAELQAYNEGLKILPNDPNLLSERSLCYLTMNQWQEALADSDHAVNSGPSGKTYIIRAQVETALGKFTNAAEDAQYMCSSACPKPSAKFNPYGQIVSALNYFQLKQSDKARAILAIAPTNTDWPYPIIEWLQGKYGIDKLMAKADDVDKKTEVYTYLALKESADGDEAKAIEHFTWVVNNGTKSYYEYAVAYARAHNALNESRNNVRLPTRIIP